LNLQTRKVLELSHSLLYLSQLLWYCSKTIEKQEERIICSKNTWKTLYCQTISPRGTTYTALYIVVISHLYLSRYINLFPASRKNSLVVLVNLYPFISIGQGPCMRGPCRQCWYSFWGGREERDLHIPIVLYMLSHK
jgi:hypothetical protein